ncbi:DUF1016 N-terminal domain-containing protein [Paenarthrobacter nicotinovorans]|uniref:DUF1016 N-terminal domain-containing protein n=1 Tax=Paenarthrobacter nicotinovorans TaxID=29320 RepID=A0ABV0GSD4_PAENI
MGKGVRLQQERPGWGSGVIKRLSSDLHAEFPEMKGLSPRNIQYMTTIAGAWQGGPIAQQAVAQLPWGHVTVLTSSKNSAGPCGSLPSRAHSHKTTRRQP